MLKSPGRCCDLQSFGNAELARWDRWERCGRWCVIRERDLGPAWFVFEVFAESCELTDYLLRSCLFSVTNADCLRLWLAAVA